MAPVSRSSTSQWISSESWRNHSTRSLPWMMGRMYSSVVGQNSESLQTLTTDGFQVTGERDRYAKRLNEATSPSKPGSASTTGSSWVTSANIRLTGWPLSSLRRPSSPGTATIRAAVTRCRLIADRLSPFFNPNAEPVSCGEANGSKVRLVQSSSMASNVALMTGVSAVSV
jgi:hypothetical protein